MGKIEQFQKHFPRTPQIHPSAFVAPNATVISDVILEEESSIWFSAVLRGDINRITIGPRSNIQDGCVIHVSDDRETWVGERVTCGHSAILHACTVRDEVLVGMGAILLDGCEIGERSIIGAGALITQGVTIPPGSLVLGSPAKVVRTLDADEQKNVGRWADEYINAGRIYRQKTS